jgi:hypothetical protein
MKKLQLHTLKQLNKVHVIYYIIKNKSNYDIFLMLFSNKNNTRHLK